LLGNPIEQAVAATTASTPKEMRANSPSEGAV
jgi:hypothetical protein